MQFVNITGKNIYTSFSGSLAPGRVSADGGERRGRLEKALAEVVNVCGSSLGIRLNSREAALIGRLMDLEEKGSKFNPESLPQEIYDDPTGDKAAERAMDEAHRRELETMSRYNAAVIGIESEIDGETSPRASARSMKGEKVDASTLKSGFEKIMEENARIEAEKHAQRSPSGAAKALDPIGANAKPSAKAEKEEAPSRAVGLDPVAVKMAKNLDGDATKSADASVPAAVSAGRDNAMDEKAAEIAGKLSILGPVDNAKTSPGAKSPDAAAKAAKSSKSAKSAKGKKK